MKADAVAAKLAALGVKLPGAASLAALLQLQGHTLCDPSSRRGLHPLVAPLAPSFVMGAPPPAPPPLRQFQ